MTGQPITLVVAGYAAGASTVLGLVVWLGPSSPVGVDAPLAVDHLDQTPPDVEGLDLAAKDAREEAVHGALDGLLQRSPGHGGQG